MCLPQGHNSATLAGSNPGARDSESDVLAPCIETKKEIYENVVQSPVKSI